MLEVSPNLKRGFISDENKKIIALVLDLFQNSTKLSIGLYDSFGNSIWRGNENASILCKCLSKYQKTKELCEEDHLKRTSLDIFEGYRCAELRTCYMGLWNISYPIIKDGIFYGAVITGQSKINSDGKLEETNEKFRECISLLRKDNIISSEIYNDINRSFTEMTDINYFSKDTFDNLVYLEKILADIISDLLQREKRITLLRHEIHNPNSTVRLTLSDTLYDIDTLLNNDNCSNEIKNRLNTIKKKIVYARGNSRLFTNIIENIFSSVDKRKKKVIFKRNNIIKMLFDAMKIFWPPADEKDVIFTRIDHYHAEIKSIFVDKSLMMRAFINAYQNAEKYSFYGESPSKPRKIDTICENTDKYFKITIINYGVGILQEEMSKIWENGYRGILSSDRHRTGSGIGLYQIKEIVEAHKGYVQIESQPRSSDFLKGPYLTKLIINLPYYHD